MLKERFRKRLKETTPLSDDLISLCADGLCEDVTAWAWLQVEEKAIKQAIKNVEERPDD